MTKSSAPAETTQTTPVKDFLDAMEILKHAAQNVEEKDLDIDTVERRITTERLSLREKYDKEDADLLEELNRVRQARRFLREATAAQRPNLGELSKRLSASPYKGSKIFRKTAIAEVLDQLVAEKAVREFKIDELYDILHRVTNIRINAAMRQRIAQHLWSLQNDGLVKKADHKKRGEWIWVGKDGPQSVTMETAPKVEEKEQQLAPASTEEPKKVEDSRPAHESKPTPGPKRSHKKKSPTKKGK